MAEKLGTGASFPELKLTLLGGESLSLPQDLDSPVTVFLVYRGHW